MAHLLETYLKASGITQSAMADALGVHQSLISQWINGSRPIAPMKAKAIEEATNGAVKRHELRPDIFDAPGQGAAA
jgi:DNA-binding transcriptional regulator YdaS (Cro superfamily)